MIYRHANPELFGGLEKPDFTTHSGNIVLFGAGKIGSVAAHKLKQMGIDFIAFVDSNPGKTGTKFCGKNVISFSRMETEYPDATVIITTIFLKDVTEQLSGHSGAVYNAHSLLLEVDWGDYGFMNTLYMERMIDFYFINIARDYNLKSPYFVDQIIINITNRCTLRCKECSVYIPYIEHPVDFDADGIIKDTANVMEVIGEFRELTLFGGEPLIHKDILRLLKYCKCSRNFKVLNIITNGTVLPDNELLEELRTENRLLVRISNYGDLSAKRDELVKMLSDNGVKHMVIDYKVWYKNLGICAPVSDERMLKYKFDCCMRANFPCVSNGKLFLCKAAMSLCEIGVFPISENNCLNLVGLRDAEREERSAKIRNYIERMRTDTYIDACKYCSGKVNLSAFNMVPPAIQSEHLLRFDRIVGTD